MPRFRMTDSRDVALKTGGLAGSVADGEPLWIATRWKTERDERVAARGNRPAPVRALPVRRSGALAC